MSASPVQLNGRRRAAVVMGGRTDLEAAGGGLPVPPISAAFQPIVNLATCKTVAYEALVRGVHGESASTVLERVASRDRWLFDEMCRVVALQTAAHLGLVARPVTLSLNLDPNAASAEAGGVERTLHAARCAGLPLARMVLEISESERLREPERLKSVLATARMEGLRTAIDDFGAGFAGLSMLAAFQPEIVKIDLTLTQGIDRQPANRIIVRGIRRICTDLGIDVVAEGVERETQRDVLLDLDICLMQGNLFAPAIFEALPEWSADGASVPGCREAHESGWPG